MNLYYKIKRKIACFLITKKVPVKLTEAIISFSFDDIPNSAITNGARILRKYGYSGTYYICLGLKNIKDPSKLLFDHTQLKKIVDEGGELACHTFSHIKLYQINKKDMISDLAKNQQQISELIPGYTFTNFSYPYGQQTFVSKLFMRTRFKSARGVSAGMHVNDADLNNLKAVELQDTILPLQKAIKLIDDAIASKAWLILYTHEVETNPSKFGCSPGYFEQIVKYCYDKKLKIQTVDQALNTIIARN